MEEKKIDGMTLNDGKGLYDNEGLCDSLIMDCNSLPKSLANGNYVQFCNIIVQMVQKLSNLKTGIRNDMDSMKNKVEDLKRMNDSLVEQMTGLPAEKDGADND